ncbi:MAG: lysine--tRNA ligase [Pelagibacterales bacterium MED-G40]|nr:MAG: lysine--tRNA ligase [Candidatus Pelagibacter sp. TMED203]PDH20427.1 MAG: lysine--tRNA ligase [Pelagibacterales bacterium MED-G40]|tara:strand:+ start:25980 stop:27542 length:1563 start_codon:yes stop_codon:yes gene_type:complete
MLDKDLIQSTSSWPFVEIRKLLKERKNLIQSKKKVVFQTGYGPSGLPHIGTFGEVARTTMMINALNHVEKIDSDLITFSDDMDGLRKVPENIDNKEVLKVNLGKPLTSIPDPFGKYKSYGEHNNEKLKEFLKKFNFKFNFISSTETYKKGYFNSSILRVLEKYDEIMNIILPTLGTERKKTYCPFLPICPDTGKVLEIPMTEINKQKGTVVFDNDGKKLETKITDGKCKLQWKVDWAMRWFAFDVDFEMYGKDLTESAILSNKICKVLGKTPPNGFAYELFLDEKGEKISKSKGNGISIDEWLRYASPESLALYMYPNPKRAKKLYSEVVPKTVDEYLSLIEKYQNQNKSEQLLNPVWHVHNGKPPKEKIVMPFSMLLNLVGSSNAKSKDILWKFIQRFHENIKSKDHPILDDLTKYAINYFNDKVQPNKKFKNPNTEEKEALKKLVEKLKSISQNLEPEDIQTIVYSVGKEQGYSKNLRDWFKLIYEVLFGEKDGPRMGFFISFFGLKETIKLIDDKIK